MSLTLRNQDPRRIRGITMLISAQDGAPGGRASQTKILDVGPNETFPVRIDVNLIRPVQPGTGPLVRVSLDGVLFEGLSFYGPNRLNSRRSLTYWEMENQRDRKYLKQVLAAKGSEALQREMLDSLSRQSSHRDLDVQVTRGRSVTSAATSPDRSAQFAFLHLPDAPVQAVEGWVDVNGNEARDARISIRSASTAAIHFVEIGWLLKDQDGKEFTAGSVPTSGLDLDLRPHQGGRLLQDVALRFARHTGQPLNIQSMRGYISQVEFEDGKVWVPSRESLIQYHLIDLLPPSPEEQRLTNIYSKKGQAAVIADLNR